MRSMRRSRFEFSLPFPALCLLAACAASPSHSPSGNPEDVATADRVKTALAEDPRLAGRQVNVSVKNGVVMLSGTVESTHDLLIVEGDVKAVPGVVGVDEEELVIRRGGTPP